MKISGLESRKEYKITTYHHSAYPLADPRIITLQYNGNPARTLTEEPGVTPDPPLIHAEVVTSNIEGEVSFTMTTTGETSGSHMNLNALEILNITGKRIMIIRLLSKLL